MWQAWTNAVIGSWLFVAAFFNASSTFNLWDDLLVGLFATIAGYTMVSEKSWEGWVSAIVGIWLIIAAFIPSLLVGTGNLANALISGAVLALTGFAALVSNEEHSNIAHNH